jgi:hypothetical protein
MSIDMFGKTDVRAIELLAEQIPRLEKYVGTCEVDSLRYIRSATLNNCRAMVAGDISQQVFEHNQGRISKIIEKFADRVVRVITYED